MIIRAYELKARDLFIKQGTTYLVIRVTDEKIIYASWSRELVSANGTYGEIGIHSQERVEYAGVKPTKKLKKPFKKDFSILSNYNFYLCESLTEKSNQEERA